MPSEWCLRGGCVAGRPRRLCHCVRGWCWSAPRGTRSWRCRGGCGSPRTPSAPGEGASSTAVWMVCATSRGRVSRGRSPMPMSSDGKLFHAPGTLGVRACRATPDAFVGRSAWHRVAGLGGHGGDYAHHVVRPTCLQAEAEDGVPVLGRPSVRSRVCGGNSRHFDGANSSFSSSESRLQPAACFSANFPSLMPHEGYSSAPLPVRWERGRGLESFPGLVRLGLDGPYSGYG
jgi:hypothetical protein